MAKKKTIGKKNGAKKAAKKAAKNGNGAPKLEAGKKQLEIPGAERKVNKELEKVLVPFVNARYQVLELQRQLPVLEAAALSKMKELNIPAYLVQDGERQVEVVHNHVDAIDKLKCKNVEAHA